MVVLCNFDVYFRIEALLVLIAFKARGHTIMSERHYEERMFCQHNGPFCCEGFPVLFKMNRTPLQHVFSDKM